MSGHIATAGGRNVSWAPKRGAPSRTGGGAIGSHALKVDRAPTTLSHQRRVSPLEVHVVYTSPRRLCKLAEGIVRGLSTHIGEAVTIHKPECMLRGDARCVIEVLQLPS